jgi:hypothetical protein
LQGALQDYRRRDREDETGNCAPRRTRAKGPHKFIERSAALFQPKKREASRSVILSQLDD